VIFFLPYVQLQIKKTSMTKKPNNDKWQENLLPFMIRTIVFLGVFFFVASLLQLVYLQVVISGTPRFDVKQVNAYFTAATSPRLKALVLLEGTALDDQYHQANVLLMARVWTTYVGFVTGMVLAVVGAVFILGKLAEPASELNAGVSGNNLSFKSTSPGLTLCVLGTALMVATIIVHHNIDTNHRALYIHDLTGDDITLPQLPPAAIPPSTLPLPRNPHPPDTTK